MVEMLNGRALNLCCSQESCGRGTSARMISGQKSTCNFFWVGKPNGTGGESILLKEKWVEHLEKVFDRILRKLYDGQCIS